jgi:hypothetical protein
MAQLHEKHESLWLIAAPLGIWALHLVLAYSTAAVWCAKAVDRSGPLAAARIAIGVYSAVALLAVFWLGWRGWRRHRLGEKPATPPYDRDTREDRYRFLGYVTVLLSGLAAIAIVYETAVIVFIRSCR